MAPQVTQPNLYRRSLLRQERSRQTREALVRAALRLWRVRGYESTTVDEISSAAGVARSTYYFHFADKDALLYQVATMSALRIGSGLTSAAEAPTIGAALADYAAQVARVVEPTPRELVARIARTVLVSIGDFGAGSTRDDLSGQLHVIFAAHTDELVPDADTVELGAIAAAMVMEGILRWSLHNAQQESLRDVLTARLELVVEGCHHR
jgi:AcrR family transcriptional regulator